MKAHLTEIYQPGDPWDSRLGGVMPGKGEGVPMQ